MAESHVVPALITKRVEMAGLIEHQQREMARLADDLAHLDATLRLFSPGVFPVGHLVGVVVEILLTMRISVFLAPALRASTPASVCA